MDSATSKRTVVVGFGASVLIVAGKQIRDGNMPKPEHMLGAAAAFVLLGFGAEFAPDLAGAMAILVVLTLILGPTKTTTTTKTAKKASP